MEFRLYESQPGFHYIVIDKNSGQFHFFTGNRALDISPKVI